MNNRPATSKWDTCHMGPVSQPVPCHGRCPHHYTSVSRNDNTNSSGDCPRPTREAGWAFTPGLWPVELRSEERVALDGHAVKRVGLPRRSTGLTKARRSAAWEPILLLSGRASYGLWAIILQSEFAIIHSSVGKTKYHRRCLSATG